MNILLIKEIIQVALEVNAKTPTDWSDRVQVDAFVQAVASKVLQVVYYIVDSQKVSENASQDATMDINDLKTVTFQDVVAAITTLLPIIMQIIAAFKKA